MKAYRLHLENQQEQYQQSITFSGYLEECRPSAQKRVFHASVCFLLDRLQILERSLSTQWRKNSSETSEPSQKAYINHIIAPNITRRNTHQLLPAWLCEHELRKENSSKHADGQAKAMKLQHFTNHYRQLMNWESRRNNLLCKMNSNLLSSAKYQSWSHISR